ncbi:MAG: glycerate kinase [Microbacteriaceae bacterium]
MAWKAVLPTKGWSFEGRAQVNGRRVVVATDSFKGSISATAVAAALGAGWRSVRPGDDVVCIPMADGGEGTLEAVARAVPRARWMPLTVRGPVGREVAASWLWVPPAAGAADAGAGARADADTRGGEWADSHRGGTAVVELASTSGIEHLRGRLRPLDAGTGGLGEAIAAALRHGVERVVVGLGSSASTDGGAGMLTALGARFLDAAGRPIRPGGRGLADLAAADLAGLAPLPPGGVIALSDVPNPLFGPDGAAAIFGPQKGATAVDVAALDAGLVRFADVLGRSRGAVARSADPAAPGAGAAGGTGYGLLAWGAALRPGAPAVAELLGLSAAVAGASIVITGEGAFDAQSAAGKVPALVAALAEAAHVPAALVAGHIARGADLGRFAHAESLTALAGGAEGALADPARWLRRAGATLARAAFGAEAGTAPGPAPAPNPRG